MREARAGLSCPVVGPQALALPAQLQPLLAALPADAEAEADAAALAAAKPDAVLVPKVERTDDIAAWSERLADVPIWAMIETPGAVLRLDAIAGAERLAGLVMGTNDLALAMRATLDAQRSQVRSFLAATVAAARAHGRIALDGVMNRIADTTALTDECADAVALGFDGKTLIHPAQIDACNAAFTPTGAAVTRAEAIVAAFAKPEAAGKGAIQLDGAMVERLHLTEAHRTLALAGR